MAYQFSACTFLFFSFLLHVHTWIIHYFAVEQITMGLGISPSPSQKGSKAAQT